jgi:hypothetical protein
MPTNAPIKLIENLCIACRHPNKCCAAAADEGPSVWWILRLNDFWIFSGMFLNDVWRLQAGFFAAVELGVNDCSRPCAYGE